MRISYIPVIKEFYEIIKYYDEYIFNIAECVFLGYQFIYHRKIDKIKCLHRNIFISVPEFILHYKIHSLMIYKKYNGGRLYIWFSKLCYKELAANIIIKYFKKFLLKRAKIRNDPLKQDLIAYFYHPSRLSFSIE